MTEHFWQGLYEKYYKSAYLYTLSLCKNKEQAEDIVSEGFEKALLTIETVQNEKFLYWLLRVCKNLWIDEVRRQSRRKRATQGLASTGVQDEDALSTLLYSERTRRLYGGIERLPQNYRELLVLYYFGQMPLSKIAELLGMNYSAAKTGLFRGRLLLKKILEEDDI